MMKTKTLYAIVEKKNGVETLHDVKSLYFLSYASIFHKKTDAQHILNLERRSGKKRALRLIKIAIRELK